MGLNDIVMEYNDGMGICCVGMGMFYDVMICWICILVYMEG